MDHGALSSVIHLGKADKRVDAVQQRTRRMTRFDPLPVGVSDFVVEPDESAPHLSTGWSTSFGFCSASGLA